MYYLKLEKTNRQSREKKMKPFGERNSAYAVDECLNYSSGNYMKPVYQRISAKIIFFTKILQIFY